MNEGIRWALEAAGSQAELARLLEVSRQRIHQLSQQETVSPEMAIKLEKLLGVPRHLSCPELWDVP